MTCNLLQLCTIISCHLTYLHLDSLLFIQFMEYKYRSLTIGSTSCEQPGYNLNMLGDSVVATKK